MSVILLILGLILFIGLVVVHEFGHFIAAKRSGIEVEEFGVGFPPRAKTLAVKNGTKFTLNWLPLGGFVKLKGEHDADEAPGSFGAASVPAKIRVMAAGVLMNLFAAFVLFTLLALIGMPRLIENQFSVKSDTKTVKRDVLVGYVEPGSPAEKAGLKVRDRLVAVGTVASQPITSADDLPNITKKYAGQPVMIAYERDHKDYVVTTVFRSTAEVESSKNTDNPKGYLGVSPTEYVVQRSTWSAPIVAVGTMWQITAATFKALGSAVAGVFEGNTAQATAQVSGPVGIVVLLKDGSFLGFNFILMIVAVISLTLAIMNLLPIPALDGGRLFVLLLFRGLKKPLKQKTEEWIHGTGFAFLMMLFVLITIVDIRRYF